MRLIAAQPNYCMNAGVSYTCLSLLEQMAKDTERIFWAYLFTPDVVRESDAAAVVPDNYDHKTWLATLRRMQETAMQRAADYTWEKVAHRRLAMLQARFGK